MNYNPIYSITNQWSVKKEKQNSNNNNNKNTTEDKFGIRWKLFVNAQDGAGNVFDFLPREITWKRKKTFLGKFQGLGFESKGIKARRANFEDLYVQYLTPENANRLEIQHSTL